MSPEVATVFWLVVAARFVLPLFIPKYPLPALLACLVLDAADQTIFQSFGFDPPGYQGYDKAMDNFYLAMAFLSSMRNWTSLPAMGVARFLFFYRMVGVVLFELTGWRAVLLLFPNTFEYFFIAYELVRTRWNPLRVSLRSWILTAATIWVVIKLPQEYWLHVAQLDFTDTVRDVPWFGPAVVVGVLALLAVLLLVVRPRLPQPDWSLRIAADPLPSAMDGADERSAWARAHGRVWSADTLEKVALVGLLSLVFAQVLDLEASNLELVLELAALVLASTWVSLALARRGALGIESLALALLVRLALNFGIVMLAVWSPLSTGPGPDTRWTAVAFFVVLLSLLTTVHDRFSPVSGYRREQALLATA